MKLAARMNDCRQYSEDGWESIAHIKEITPKTTVGELMEWQESIFKTFEPKDEKPIPQIIISSMYGTETK